MRLFDFLIKQNKEIEGFMDDMQNNRDSFLKDQSHLYVIGTCGDCEHWEIMLEAATEEGPQGKCWARKMEFWNKNDGCRKWQEKKK